MATRSSLSPCRTERMISLGTARSKAALRPRGHVDTDLKSPILSAVAAPRRIGVRSRERWPGLRMNTSAATAHSIHWAHYLRRVDIGSIARRGGALVAFLVLWYAVTASGLIQEQIVPRPLTVLTTFLELTFDWSEFARQNLQYQLVISTALSLARVVAGLAISLVGGGALGSLLAWVPLCGF